MARYEAQTIIDPIGKINERSVIPDAGTSVTVEFFNGAEWVADSQSPITVPNTVFCRGLRVRYTPDTGGFFVDEEIYS
jgi:hypothetical protein